MRFGRAIRRARFRLTTKILIVFLALSITSLAVVGSIAFVSMRGMGKYALEGSSDLGERAVLESTAALEDQAEQSLIRLARDQAALSNTLFEKVEAEVQTVSHFASAMWNSNSPPLERRQYSVEYSAEKEPSDIYAVSAYKLAPEIAPDVVKDELNRSASLVDIFIPIYANDHNLAWIYIGTESGIIQLYPWTSALPESYDPRQRGWYEQAVTMRTTEWTEPYVDAGEHGLMVTCSTPILDSANHMVGVVAADVTMETINNRIINTQIGKFGYAFLIDTKGKVVSRPGMAAGDKRWDETYQTENLLNSNDPDLQRVAERMIAGETGIATINFEGGPKYIAYAPVNSTDWSIGVVMPVGEIIAPAQAIESQLTSATEYTSKYIDSQIDNMQNIFIGIFVAILAIVAGLAFLLARNITRPVMALKKGSEAIGKGDLEYKVQVSTGDEIEELAESFNKMASDLKAHIEELRCTTAEKERISKELEIAGKIQQTFLPGSPPTIEGAELAASNVPVWEVGGDFYDFIPIPGGKWGLVMADVSGKGVPAALFMALSRTLVRANAVGSISASEAIRKANNLIAEDDRSNMFVTLFYGVLEPKSKTLTYVNAGHNSPLILRKDGMDIIMLAAKGIAMGVMPDIDLEEKEIRLEEGDVLVLYTDGVTEAINSKEEQFGQERLIKLVEENRHLSPQEIIKAIQQEITAFSQGQPQFDDVTLMILKVP